MGEHFMAKRAKHVHRALRNIRVVFTRAVKVIISRGRHFVFLKSVMNNVENLDKVSVSINSHLPQNTTHKH